MLKQRIITGAGLTCAIAAALLLSGHIWFLKAVSVILSVMAAWELCRAGGYLQQKAFLLGTLAAAVFFALFGTAAPVGMVLLLALTAAVLLMCQVQNLTEVPKGIILLTASASAYGTLLPGHGGILDRFDSLVFVIPFTVFVTRCFGPLFSQGF